MGCIYFIRNKINGKGYIGKTSGSIEKRRASHVYEAFHGGDSCPCLYNAIRKYGLENFEWKIVFNGADESEIDELEIQSIAIYRTLKPNGYNLKIGGQGGPHDEVTKRKISEKAKSRSKELAKFFSKVNSGRKQTQAHREKISKLRKGKTYEEIFGVEKARQLREIRSKANIKRWEEFRKRKTTGEVA